MPEVLWSDAAGCCHLGNLQRPDTNRKSCGGDSKSVLSGRQTKGHVVENMKLGTSWRHVMLGRLDTTSGRRLPRKPAFKRDRKGSFAFTFPPKG
ncbi:unnamed protein product [Protopolystoma xenopodis]|uniref:Uncharacterized protein n=1 Tax=Protopolystoma xenopodis TaxID=117903 RepID=A0A3S4ZQH2_9PLAT|nr:unnamed protein product [Protopolystoma xenopodis]